MSDLTRDLRIGKKFSRHDELRERERKARLKAKLEKDGDASEAGLDDTQSPTPAPASTNESTVQPKSDTPGNTSTPSAAAAPSGPQFRIVDGQIVVDQSSLVMDRHARAAAARGNQDMETIEENDFTRLITSSSFMNTSKLKGPNIWTEPETELFYRGLRMFGTEFEMISKMFPGKQRRHIKLKYNREERHNPARINAAAFGEKTIKIDIDEYRAFTGAQYESVETIEAEQRKIEETYEAERQRVADEQAEIMRKKKEELFADEDGEEGDFKKKRKGKKKGKQAIRYGLNGEPITDD
jgi:transcription factor TFIIIB component B''